MKLRFPVLTACLAAIMFFASCSGGGKSSPPPANITVSIAPKNANLQTGRSLQFTANVTGTDNKAVNWSLQEPGAGAIAQDGSYTAPMAAGTYHVVAASAADPAKSDTATVTVAPQGGLAYTDPSTAGNYSFRFIKNTDLSTPTHLVFDLVAAGQASQCAGLAFTVSHDRASAASWAKVAQSDQALVQNGTVFSLGSSPIGLKATAAGTRLNVVAAQKGASNLADLNSGVLARIALDANAGAASGAIGLSVEKFQIISINRAITNVSTSIVRFGELAVI